MLTNRCRAALKTELREELARGDGAAAPRRASRRESNAGRLSLSGRIMGTGNTIGGADDARDCLFDKASESYYFRVQTMVLFNEPSPRLALHVVVVVVAMMLQLFALSTVWQTIWFPFDVARWGVDDQAMLECIFHTHLHTHFLTSLSYFSPHSPQNSLPHPSFTIQHHNPIYHT